MSTIANLFEAQEAAESAVNRFACRMLRWTCTPPVLPGLYAWRCGKEGPEFVGVGSIEHNDGTFGPLLIVDFESRPVSLIEVLGAYPGSEWAKVRRGGKHESS